IQGGEAPRDFAWAEVSVWTKRMLSALGNGVKGGRWYALVDKVFAPNTLAAAWTKVRANKGAAGVDGQSIERFAAKAEDYLAELSAALREGAYRPQAVKRVDIPEGDGRARPLGIPTVTLPLREQHRGLRQVLNGHYQDLGVIFNYRSMRVFKECVVRYWRKTLGKRSQKGRMNWATYRQLLTAFPLPEPAIHQAWLQ